MTEEKAIHLCLTMKDPSGFEYLVAQYRREAFFHAFALLQNEADAADACQDAFSRAFGAMPRLARLDHFYPWFYRILRNRCLNILDRRKTRENYANRERKLHDNVDTRDPSFLAETTEESRLVWETLQTLDDKSRVILTLKYVNGFSYDQIASTLRIPRGTVMSRLYQARQRFIANYSRETQ